MTDLLRDDTDFEMSKYYEARDILEAGVNPAIEKNKKSVFNTETGMNDVLLPMSNGGYIKIANEDPKVMSEAPKQPTGMSRTEEILEYAKTPGISEKEDFEAAGFTPEEIEAAFPTRQDVKPITVPEPRTEEISQEEMADRISKGEAFFVPNDTLREQGTSLVNEFFFDRAVDALRDELQEQGMAPDQIEREIQARSPEFMRNAEVYSNALFGTGATGFEVGAADFLTAGAMDIQEGYNLFSANMPGKGDSVLGRAMGMGLIAAGIAEATGVGYGFGKLLKKGIDKLRPTLARMGDTVKQRAALPGDMPTVGSLGGNVAEFKMPSKTQPGIIAFHGSGKKFDKFKLEYIGTGEGNQAYGYGLYFAEKEGIAEFYKDAMREERNILHLDGKPIDSVYTADNEEKFSEYVNKNFKDEEINDVYSVIDNLGQGLSSITDADAMAAASLTKSQMQIYNKIKNDLEIPELPEGAMYKVNLATNPENLIDYQLPIADQDEKFLKAFKEIYHDKIKSDPDLLKLYPTPDDLSISDIGLMEKSIGGQAYNTFAKDLFNGDQAALSEALLSKGIPGIKYRDAGSRGGSKTLKDSTFNFVIFDDKLIDILKKYGIVGPVAVTAMQPKEQEEI